MAVRDRGLFCYRLLLSGIEEVKRILWNPKSGPSLGVLEDQPDRPINSWAKDFNTLVPVYGKDRWAVLASHRKSTFDLVAQNTAPLESVSLVSTNDKEDQTKKTGIESLNLIPNVQIEPEVFERKWIMMEVACQKRIPLQGEDGMDSLQTALHVVNIHTIARSRPGTQPWKAYLYAEDDQDCLFLTELLHETNSTDFVITVKQSKSNTATLMSFVSFLETVIETVLNIKP